MYKIAILGCENSHANGFLSLINVQKKYPDLEVIGVYSDDMEASKKLCEKFGVPVLSSYDEVVGRVDGIIITARHGDNHLKYAKPYITSGIPMFIDKPITCSEEDSLELARLAKANGVKLCGGSICGVLPEIVELAEKIKTGEICEVSCGHVGAPFEPVNDYGNFFFYSEHLIDMMTAVFGYGIKEICADIRERDASAIVQYEKYNITCSYTTRVASPYGVTVYANSGVYNVMPEMFRPDSANYIPELDSLLHLLKGGEMEKTYEEFILPTFVMNAMVRSSEKRGWEALNEIKL